MEILIIAILVIAGIFLYVRFNKSENDGNNTPESPQNQNVVPYKIETPVAPVVQEPLVQLGPEKTEIKPKKTPKKTTTKSTKSSTTVKKAATSKKLKVAK